MVGMLLVLTMSCGNPCSALRTDAAMFWYATLLAEGGHGALEREKAAFLIRERNGTLSLAPWSVSGDRHASFRGAIPVRAIAIVHTHPPGAANPSAQDRREARRLGLDVIVVTPEGVVTTRPDGTSETLATRGWSAR